MARHVFFIFHFKPDSWRASLVRSIGAVAGNKPASDNDWEAIVNGRDEAIKSWIDAQLLGRSCTVVLIGADTAGRKWINYEIVKSWDSGMGVLGIHIHGLKDINGMQSTQGLNPFDAITMGKTGRALSGIVETYDPPYRDSKAVYNYIGDNLATWIETAIADRARH